MDVTLQTRNSDLLDEWVAKFEKFLRRFKKLDEENGDLIYQTLDKFGQSRERYYWRPILRDNKRVSCNGLPDLLDAWDFLNDLSKEPNRYEEGVG